MPSRVWQAWRFSSLQAPRQAFYMSLHFAFLGLTSPLFSLHEISRPSWNYIVSLCITLHVKSKWKPSSKRAGLYRCYHNWILTIWHHPQGVLTWTHCNRSTAGKSRARKRGNFQVLSHDLNSGLQREWEVIRPEFSVSVSEHADEP